MDESLLDLIKKKQDGDRLFHTVAKIKENATPLLGKIAETFPEYTPHDIFHKERVLNKFKLLIPNSLAEKLNAYEIYFLIAATYLHDVGMANLSELVIPTEYLTNAEKTRNFIRDLHHERTEQFVVRHFQDLSVEDIHQAKIIGRICRGHRKENLHDSTMFEPERMYKEFSINIPLLASLLRLADELDITFERVPMILYEHIPPRDDISKEEWAKQENISGIGISKEDPLLIKCSATCHDPKIHRALKRLQDKIGDELDDLFNHLHYYHDCRKDLPRKFRINIESIDYTPYDLKFSLKEKAIVHLLMGEKLYKTKDESIRELLKNSVDGCRLRKELLEKKGSDFQPKIIAEASTERGTIEISDNGVGMDEDKVERYFTKIGQSFYRSSEFLEKNHDFTPVSELGIGILSCFMISDRIFVETKTDESEPLLIEIDDISDYFIVRKGSRTTTGTTVTLILKDDAKAELMAFPTIVRNYVRHLGFPVKAVLNGNVMEIADVSETPDLMTYMHWRPNFLKFHVLNIDDEYAKGYVALLGNTKQDVDWYPVENNYHLYQGRESTKLFGVSNEGIFVSNEFVLPRWLESTNVVSDLNIKHGSLDLNAARNEIMSNDKLVKFRNNLEIILVDDFSTLLKDLEKNSKSTGHNKIDMTKQFFDRYIVRDYSLNELNKDNKLTPKFIDFIKEFYYFKCTNKDGVYFKKYAEIIGENRKIVLIEGIYRQDDDYLQHVFGNITDLDSDAIYVIGEEPTLISILFGKFIFDKFWERDFQHLFEMEEIYDLSGMIQKTWKVIKFFNYNSELFMEDFPSEGGILNANNKFIDLLIKNKDFLKEEKRMIVEGFFRTLKLNLKNNFDRVIEQQKEILNGLISEKKLNREDIHLYLLTKDQFPKRLLRE